MASFGSSADDRTAALSELATAREATYFDADADARARAAYYVDLDRALGPDELFLSLCHLVTGTHTVELEYRPAVHLYPSVDLQPNGRLLSIYTGEEFDPEEFIDDDLEVAAQRSETIQQRLMAAMALTDHERQVMAEAVEDELPFNCEHVVPQAWFAKRLPMRADLHHLFACQKACNNFRAAIPYFDFTGFRDVIRERCGMAGPSGFEPHQGKGEVARATLYFLVRYPGRAKPAEGPLDPARVEVLLAWHEGHPVTEHERHRNALIQSKQGNRNPFIDEPEPATRIGFHSALQPNL